MALRVRWLGRVPYGEALAVQHALFRRGTGRHLLLLEHPHVITHGPRADLRRNVLVDPAAVGAELVAVDRGGDVTYHGPGQLVGYPIIDLPHGMAAADHVAAVQRVVVGVLHDLGVDDVGTLTEFPGVWVGLRSGAPRKICAIGVRLGRGTDGVTRTMHGFALNVSTDMRFLREHIVPCGIGHLPVTSLEEEGVESTMAEVVEAVAGRAAAEWGDAPGPVGVERQDVTWRTRTDDLAPFSRGAGASAAPRGREDHHAPVGPSTRAGRRLAAAGVVGGLEISTRKPEWLRPRVRHDAAVLATRRAVQRHDLVTVCEEAGCPNLSECWGEGTATFMVLGERCTRACGFCLVDTRKPLEPAVDEPARIASAVQEMGLRHVVLTMVARDDLDDGGMAHVAACVRAIRSSDPSVAVETLISDASGDHEALARLFDARPDVCNHNIETVARLQWAVRPSAGYARSLAVLAAVVDAGIVAKSGFMVGLGERPEEIEGLLADLAAIGVSIVTIGQYLRPTGTHLPVARWVPPDEFTHWRSVGEALGITHVEASPLTRSSHHAGSAAASVGVRRGQDGTAAGTGVSSAARAAAIGAVNTR